MNFDKEAKSDKKNLGKWGVGGGGGALKPKQCQTVLNEVKYKNATYLHNVQHVVQSTLFKIR